MPFAQAQPAVTSLWHDVCGKTNVADFFFRFMLSACALREDKPRAYITHLDSQFHRMNIKLVRFVIPETAVWEKVMGICQAQCKF
jgi:hypothetical protein